MTRDAAMPRTLFEKIWNEHVVLAEEGRQTILYIDLHLVHEVTSPQAFDGLRLARRKVRRPERTVATADHNVPTTDRSLPIADPISGPMTCTMPWPSLPRANSSMPNSRQLVSSWPIWAAAWASTILNLPSLPRGVVGME